MSFEVSKDLEDKARAMLEKEQNASTPPTVDVRPSAKTEAFTVEYDTVPKPMSPEEFYALSNTPSAPVMEDVPISLEEDDIVLSDPTATESAPVEELFSEETLILGQEAVDKVSEMPSDARTEFLSKLVPQIKDYRKDLVTKYGYTPEEADEAAKNRASRLADEEYTSYKENHPDSVVVEIDKSQEEALEFTDDELNKIQNAKVLRLVVVESRDLETLNVKSDGEEIDMGNIRDICGSIARYSVPLLMSGDYATFYGAQSVQLVNCTVNDNDKMIDILEKRASLLYSCFAGSTLRGRTDKNGKLITYEEFCNWFLYDDVDLALYAIVTASSMETTDTIYTCNNPNCGRSYQITYNQKALLDLSDLSDKFKARVDEVDESRSNVEKLQALHEQYTAGLRVKSPVTNNVYEIYHPNIAQIRKACLTCGDELADDRNVTALPYFYMHRMWIYDPSAGNYYKPVQSEQEPDKLWEMMKSIPQIDIKMLYKFLNEHVYAPRFHLKTKCPYCGRDRDENLTANDMVFLAARASLMEIR